MRPYQLLISYDSFEKPIADEIVTRFTFTFSDKVAFSHLPSDTDKDDQNNILSLADTYDAILIILTPQFAKQPLAYAAWTPFWINNKKTFVVISDDLDVTEIAPPMRENIKRLFDESEIRKVITEIWDLVNPSSPVDHRQAFFIGRFTETHYISLHNDYTTKATTEELYSENNSLTEEAFWHRYNEESKKGIIANQFEQIPNTNKINILKKLIEKRDYPQVEKLIRLVKPVDDLTIILKFLLSIHEESHFLIKLILEYIKTNQKTLRTFGEFIIEDIGYPNNILPLTIPMFDNMTELRRLGESVIDNNYSESDLFDEIVLQLIRHSMDQLQILLIHLIEKEISYNIVVIKKQISNLALINPYEAEKIMTQLMHKNCKVVKDLIYNTKIIVEEKILKRIVKRIEIVENDA